MQALCAWWSTPTPRTSDNKGFGFLQRVDSKLLLDAHLNLGGKGVGRERTFLCLIYVRVSKVSAAVFACVCVGGSDGRGIYA